MRQFAVPFAMPGARASLLGKWGLPGFVGISLVVLPGASRVFGLMSIAWVIAVGLRVRQVSIAVGPQAFLVRNMLVMQRFRGKTSEKRYQS